MKQHDMHQSLYGIKAFGRILKLPVIFEKVPVQNGLKMVQNGLKLYKMAQNGNFLPIKNGTYSSK